MCGIAGTLNLDGAPATRDATDAMIRALAHRGPDAQGIHLDGPCALGHVRLSIVDLAGGGQPMANEDGSIWVVFGGEIFNHVELRADLEKRGHRFATHADTEVLLHLYEEEGEDCVHALNGQWAFALWDAARRRLFLSRDRMGVRPLYFARTRAQFVFGSEIKALCTHPGVGRDLDPAALDQIFTFWAPLAPRTILRDVSEVPPGHSLSIDERGQHVLKAYWRPDYRPASAPASESRCAEQLLELLREATRIRLRADVPVGAYLSGGLDSSVIAGLIAQLRPEPLRTFSVAFDEPEFDESAYQDDVRRLLGTEHTRLRCSAADVGRVFPEVIWHTERPIVRTGPAPLYLLSERVRDAGYKVVVTGEGADEILGGYDIFKEAKIRAFWARQPQSARRPRLLKRLYPYLQDVQAQPDAYLQAFFRLGGGASSCFFSHLPRWQATAGMKRLFSGDLRARLAGYDAYGELKRTLPAGFAEWDWFSRAQYLETAVLLPGYILSSQGDRVAMAHGVEGRFPFLDHRVVEFAASLPARLKLRVLDEKYILKRAAGHLVPATVLRRTKQPYRAPESACFVSPDGRGAIPEYVEALLEPARVKRDGVFNPHAVGLLLRKARAGAVTGTRDNMALVAVLSTQLVMDQFVRRAA